MTRTSPCRARLAALVLLALGSGVPTAVLAAGVTVSAKAPFDAGARASGAVRSQCQLETLVPSYVVEASQGSSLASGALPAEGHTLALRITEVQAPGGGMFSGPKWLEVSGTLRDGGKTLASFRAKRLSTGGPFGGGGTCGMLQKCARAIAQDVAAWLEHPTPGAELGDAR